MSLIGKWQANFFIALVTTWLSLKGRYSFENLSRQGEMSSESYRSNFSNSFDLKTFNRDLFEYIGLEKVWAFDASFLSKSGTKTYGIGYFWSGCAQKVKPGMEIAGLVIVDVKNHTAFHYYATQTKIEDCQKFLDYYAEIIVKDAMNMLLISKYVTVDAYFSKKTFIDPVCKEGFDLISRLRNDSVMFYAYLGPHPKTRGRKRKFAGKVDAKNLDESQFSACIKEDKWTAYEALVYVKSLKRWCKVVVIQHYHLDKTIKKCNIFISTDVTQSGCDVFFYYHLRFQIEFVYRDTKQHLGLNHCQSTQKERLDFHHNFSLTMLSLAKITHWLSKSKENRKAFSIHDIKAQYFNERFLNKIFNVFAITPEQQLNNPNINCLRNYAKIAA